MAKDAALSSIISAGTAGLGNKAIPSLSKSIGKLSEPLSNYLKKGAGYLAELATGATGKQVEKFEKNAGQELLDRGFVKFGDAPKNIANKLEKELDRSGGSISNIIKELDAKGITASADNVVAGLNEEIARLSKNSSKSAEVKKLQSIIDDIINTGESNIPISLAEETKRGFRKQSGNWLDPEAGAAAKKGYLGYMNESERAATEAAPELANLFKKEKETYGLLAPIEEAAQKRANTLGQSPIGGLLDTAAGGVGGAILSGSTTGDPWTGLAAGTVGRRLIAPRLASSAAIGLHSLSKALKSSPEMFGKFAPVLLNASQRGGNALGAAHFILQSQNPEYREQIKNLKDGEEDEDGR